MADRAAPLSGANGWEGLRETPDSASAGILGHDDRPDRERRADRLLDRVFTHLRAHVAELRRLEAAGAKREELEERRTLIWQLQVQLAELVRTTLSSALGSDEAIEQRERDPSQRRRPEARWLPLLLR
jgi:hypothetical protein